MDRTLEQHTFRCIAHTLAEDILSDWFAPALVPAAPFVLSDFKHALDTIAKCQPTFLVKTPLLEIKLPAHLLNGRRVPRIFIKDETSQRAQSFKPRGVLYDIERKIRELVAEKPDALKGDTPFFIVTQSTGNHGAALAQLGADLQVSMRCVSIASLIHVIACATSRISLRTLQASKTCSLWSLRVATRLKQR